jgi:hypothetical protein
MESDRQPVGGFSMPALIRSIVSMRQCL